MHEWQSVNPSRWRMALAAISMAAIAGTAWFIRQESPPPGLAAIVDPDAVTSTVAGTLPRSGKIVADAPRKPEPVVARDPRPAAPGSAARVSRTVMDRGKIEEVPGQSVAAGASLPRGATATAPVAHGAGVSTGADAPVAPNRVRDGQLLESSPPFIYTAADLAALAPVTREAEEVHDTHDPQQVMEKALLTATAKAKAPDAVPNATTRDAMDGLIGAFVKETDPETKVDLLASAQELSTNSGASIQRFLALALQPQQPEDVQEQALYLAASHLPALVERIAADASHPFHDQAEAFLREKRLEKQRAGTSPAPP